jgi:exoribonuclease II
MEPGNIVEYIDRQKIICSIVLDIKNEKLRLLNESNREVGLSAGRVLHAGKKRFNPSSSRDALISLLKETAQRRDALIDEIDMEGLWEVLHDEPQWIDIADMTGLCFPVNADSDHEAAVIRAFFKNRLYFKFDQSRFFPYSEDQVRQSMALAEENERKTRIIEKGAVRLKKLFTEKNIAMPDPDTELESILRSVYLFGKLSPHYAVGKEILSKAGVSQTEDLFPALVKLNVFDKDENIDLLRMEIPVDFPGNVRFRVADLIGSGQSVYNQNRSDLTHLDIMTIDGPETRDFDDALSLETHGENVRLGVHIVDVGYFVAKGDVIDQEALFRGSSIYMPDQKISMLPGELAEGICSLKCGEKRPAISVMIVLTPAGKLVDYDIVASVIAVKRQLTYGDADAMAGENKEIQTLLTIAKQFRQKRFMQGAVHISLPEVNLWIDEAKEIHMQRFDRESPGRMLISEMMIMANALIAKHLAQHQMPAVFRAQTEPKERLYKGEDGTLFQNYMQRRHLNRFKLGNTPEPHSGLGLEAYVTATSPIRKYYDLASQRQLRSLFGLETPYQPEEISHIMALLETPLQNVGRVQMLRNRYWMLKYLEKKIGVQHEAMVLLKKRTGYQILLPDYMIECDLPVSAGMTLKPEDLIHVKIQHVDARKDLLAVFLG